MNSDPVIEVRGLCKRVTDATGELTILDGIDLSVHAGSSVAIVGASGSGKSTLLGLLAGLDSASAGSVRLLGHELTGMAEDQRAALRNGSVGFVFQSFQLMPHLSALENVALPLELQGGITTREAFARARALLERVGLGQRTGHYPKLLSGGEQQRVALARAFVTHPAVLFADEPTGSLDAATGHAVIDLMFELNRFSGSSSSGAGSSAGGGATLVLVTHDIDLARRCDAVVTIEAGRRVPNALHVDSPENVREAPEAGRV
ncbi:ABC transporter ATP-binding protein [Paraburkholderia tagetis]|uniref:ATP-binding cassette domain-containing protein n=1 Tax=Paraburkholderia tagetis TaxID=2913261 RepID=A0A9X1RPV7_9BURK|nr:ATP-binding cassette domain-containing protein [Paraburkholderia tagetis]MCG5073746.1 ATP-binding cassette domain-containing protein [Paraburkholderia tagetis]